MYIGKLQKKSTNDIVNGTFSVLPIIGRQFKLDNNGTLGGALTSNVRSIIETTSSYCRFDTIDGEYTIFFRVNS